MDGARDGQKTDDEKAAGAQVMANFQVSQGPDTVSRVEVDLRDGEDGFSR